MFSLKFGGSFQTSQWRTWGCARTVRSTYAPQPARSSTGNVGLFGSVDQVRKAVVSMPRSAASLPRFPVSLYPRSAATWDALRARSHRLGFCADPWEVATPHGLTAAAADEATGAAALVSALGWWTRVRVAPTATTEATSPVRLDKREVINAI